MKVKIRRGFFEINSSSSHNVCIALTPKYIEIPPTVHFNNFGSSFEPFNDTLEKSNYLYNRLFFMIRVIFQKR